jgi:hypothetical protein
MVWDIRRIRVVAVSATVSVLVLMGLSACGSSESSSTEPPRSSVGEQTSTSSEEQSETTNPAGPEGEMTATSFGSVEQGMEISEVVELWGEPDNRERFPGCELNPSAPDVIGLNWNLPDGVTSLSFNADTERLDSYRTSSKSYPTRTGVRVGDEFAVLKDSEGTSLQPVSLGTETATAQSGVWQTGDPAGASQLFDIAGGKITSITGGEIQFCE